VRRDAEASSARLIELSAAQRYGAQQTSLFNCRAKFEIATNLKTAKGLGVAVPPLLVAKADEATDRSIFAALHESGSGSYEDTI
jgi:hypothetical protein